MGNKSMWGKIVKDRRTKDLLVKIVAGHLSYHGVVEDKRYMRFETQSDKTVHNILLEALQISRERGTKITDILEDYRKLPYMFGVNLTVTYNNDNFSGPESQDEKYSIETLLNYKQVPKRVYIELTRRCGGGG